MVLKTLFVFLLSFYTSYATDDDNPPAINSEPGSTYQIQPLAFVSPQTLTCRKGENI
jgi:hypothetical protein